MSKPSLSIVQGSGSPRVSKWLTFPATVVAPSPFDKAQTCEFRIAREDLVKSVLSARRQPIFELWSCILGAPPPVNNVETFNLKPSDGLTSLGDAHACFQGVKRPCGEDDDGSAWLAYILKPDAFYEYVSHMACVAHKQEAPSDIVFVAYVRLDEPCAPDGHRVKGVLTHWHFVIADEADASLPEEYQKRYDRRLW